MTGRTLVALYEDPSSAWLAAGGLEAANVPQDRVQVIGGADGTSALGEGFNMQTGFGALAESRGFGVPGTDVEALTLIGVPEEEARSYAEAVRRGATLLVVQLDDEHEHRVRNVIRGHASPGAFPDDGTVPPARPSTGDGLGQAAAGMRGTDAADDRVRVYEAPGIAGGGS